MGVDSSEERTFVFWLPVAHRRGQVNAVPLTYIPSRGKETQIAFKYLENAQL